MRTFHKVFPKFARAKISFYDASPSHFNSKNIQVFIIWSFLFREYDSATHIKMEKCICIKFHIATEVQRQYYFLFWNYEVMICTSNHMFKMEIRDKFTEFTFSKF